MKTVAAEVHSSTPVTISKAASVLSKFVSVETGASLAVNAYLRRATVALDELVRLHSKSDRKKRKKHKSDSLAITATGGTPEPTQGPTSGFENGRKNNGCGNTVDDEGLVGEDTETRRKKKKDGDFDGGGEGEEIQRTKHKRRRRNRDSVGDSEVTAVEIENRVVEKKRKNKEEGSFSEIGELKIEERKKRKNREIGEISRDESDFQRSDKKKKRRRGGEDDN